MALTSTARLLSPEEIAVQAGEQVPFLRLPDRSGVFAEREMRLRQRAAAHGMRDFLLFAAEIAKAQQQVLAAYPVVPLPDAAALEAASRLGAPPLPATLWPRNPAWRAGLARLIDLLLPRLAASPAVASVRSLRQADPAWIEQQADRLLNGMMLGLDMAAAPLIAAGLQLYWTHLVLATQQRDGDARLAPFGRVDNPRTCPCCASLPVASVSRIGAAETGFRYLHCSLCSVQWHMVRIKCSNCLNTKGIHYQSLQHVDAADDDDAPVIGKAPRQAVEAETCDECGHYLKIVHMERDAHVEPVADDLSTLALDLLVAEAGFQRHGVNLMLLFGSDEPEEDAPAVADATMIDADRAQPAARPAEQPAARRDSRRDDPDGGGGG